MKRVILFVLGAVLTACAPTIETPTLTPDPTRILQITHTRLDDFVSPTAARTPSATSTRRPTSTPTATPTLISLPTAYATIPADWLTYTSTEYAFTFQHPAAWSLEEQPIPAPEDLQLGTFIRLRRDDLELTIGVKYSGEFEVQIGCTGTAAGDTIEGGAIIFLGEDLPIVRLVYQDKLKTIFYERPCAEFRRGNLVFFIALRDDNPSFEDIDIGQEAIEESTQILMSFRFLP